MACIRKRRGRYVVDYRDAAGIRRWQTYETRHEADAATSSSHAKPPDGGPTIAHFHGRIPVIGHSPLETAGVDSLPESPFTGYRADVRFRFRRFGVSGDSETHGAVERRGVHRVPMTPRRAAFVREYLVDLNATQAAIRAGYAPKVANREGTRLLSNAVISAAIREAQSAQGGAPADYG